VTPNAPFDRWLAGDQDALTEQELQGYQLFKSAGCVACHQGRGVGGNMFQKFGVIGNYMEDRGNITDADLGRFTVTGDQSDRFVFKVPSLRNIEHTAPYLHDGSAKTLEEAVQIMGRYQLGRPLTEDEVGRLVAFLKTLSGDIPDVSSYQAWVKSRPPHRGEGL
jgi:cytochrome c peroxidase